MFALNDVIEFLLELLRDDDARTAFEQDPGASLARAGLQDVTGQDVRDAQLLVADSGTVRADGHGPARPGGDDPVREITYTTQHFQAVQQAPAATVTIDDRDTFFINDSSGSTTDVTIIDDSFNDVAVDNSSTDVNVDDSVDNSSVVNDVVAIQDNDVTTIDNAVDNSGDNSADNSVDDSVDATIVTVDQSPDDATPDAFPDPAPEPEPDVDLQPDPDPDLDAELDPAADLVIG